MVVIILVSGRRHGKKVLSPFLQNRTSHILQPSRTTDDDVYVNSRSGGGFHHRLKSNLTTGKLSSSGSESHTVEIMNHDTSKK